jgi:iron complex outermembrane receptor protein
MASRRLIERSGPRGGITGSRAASLLTCTSLALYQCSGIGQVVDDIAAAHYNDLAAYAQATYSLLEQLKVTGGVRYTSDQMTTSTNQIDRVFPAPNTPFVFCQSALATTGDGCRLSYRNDTSAPTYMADLDYTPIRDVLLYGKYARGYRQGGVTSLAADQFHLYKPEFVNDYEIGEKTTFRGRINGTFNVDGFYSDFSGQQLYASFLGPVGTVPAQGIVNAGTSHIWGIEVESAITPVRPLTVGLSYTYLNTKVISRPPTPLPTGGYTTVLFPSAVNGALPYAPKNKFSTNARYKLPLPESAGNLSYSAIFTYVSSSLATVNSPFGVIRPYGLLDMNLNWGSIAGSPVDAELFASNITNRLYYTNADPAYDSTYGIGIRYLGPPRMYGLRVQIHFGK